MHSAFWILRVWLVHQGTSKVNQGTGPDVDTPLLIPIDINLIPIANILARVTLQSILSISSTMLLMICIPSCINYYV